MVRGSVRLRYHCAAFRRTYAPPDSLLASGTGCALITPATSGSTVTHPDGSYAASSFEPPSELGASRCAPSSTPTPRRSTSSPPSQPVTTASAIPETESAIAEEDGFRGLRRRANQLAPNNPVTRTFPNP